jgi:hypothetical protein
MGAGRRQCSAPQPKTRRPRRYCPPGLSVPLLLAERLHDVPEERRQVVGLSRGAEVAIADTDRLRARGSAPKRPSRGEPHHSGSFPSPTNEPWDDRHVRWHIWRPLLRRAGLRHRGPHQLRHSYASLLIAAGAHPGPARPCLHPGHDGCLRPPVPGDVRPPGGRFGRRDRPQPRRNRPNRPSRLCLCLLIVRQQPVSTCSSPGPSNRRPVARHRCAE